MPINELNFQPEKFKVFVRVMIQAAKEKRCVTYNELENIFGLSHKQIGHYSGALGDYCMSRKLPPLNSLIISSTDCMPSNGFDWYQEKYNTSWGELISTCYKKFHITSAPSKKSEDFSGRDSDVVVWLDGVEEIGYKTET